MTDLFKVNNKKVVDGIVASPGNNTNMWYCREPNRSFSLHGSFSGVDELFDWVSLRTTNTKSVKSGVYRVASKNKSIIDITFTKIFQDNNYFVFFLPNKNINVYTCQKKKNKVVVSGSFSMGTELSWIAIHKSFAIKTGLLTPGSIFTSSRSLLTETTTPPSGELDINNDTHANLDGWYNCEYIIKPSMSIDGFLNEMNLESYSSILSPTTNHNLYWVEKTNDRVKIGTSFPCECDLDFLFMRNGIDWWNEIDRDD